MIFQVRGTSGSGKSWVMRRVMEEWTREKGEAQLVYREGRKRPLYYLLPGGVAVVGHYESPCGGGDSIGSAPAIYDLTMDLLNGGGDLRVVLQEGLLLSEDSKWSIQMPDLIVYYLTTPLDRCLRQVGERRREQGNEKPLNPHNTENRVGVIQRSRAKLEAAGVRCRACSAPQCVELILNQLRLHAQ